MNRSTTRPDVDDRVELLSRNAVGLLHPQRALYEAQFAIAPFQTVSVAQVFDELAQLKNGFGDSQEWHGVTWLEMGKEILAGVGLPHFVSPEAGAAALRSSPPLPGCDGTSGYSLLSYDKIVEYTGVHRSRVRPALSSLYETRLVGVDPTMDPRAKLNAPRRYVVEGLVRQRLADAGASVPGLMGTL